MLSHHQHPAPPLPCPLGPAAETVLTASHILTELAKTRMSAELLQPGELVSGMLLQVGRQGWVAGCLVAWLGE